MHMYIYNIYTCADVSISLCEINTACICTVVCIYMYIYIHVHVHTTVHAVLLCFVVCLTLLASLFLPTSTLINMYIQYFDHVTYTYTQLYTYMLVECSV